MQNRGDSTPLPNETIGSGQELVAPDAKEQLCRWDAGETIWSVEMGGIGPGYEQAIQTLAIEIVRDYLSRPLPDETTWSDFGSDTVTRIDYRLPDGRYSCGGFSGAQVGAAKQLAYRWLKDGPQKAHDSAPEDRRILVSKTWPHAPETPRGPDLEPVQEHIEPPDVK